MLSQGDLFSRTKGVQMMNRMLFAIGLVLLAASCTVQPLPPPKTALMKQLEADGAGDLSGPKITAAAVYAWLRPRPDAYNKKLQQQCAAMVKTGVAVEWHESVDAKICEAANSIVIVELHPRNEPSFLGGNR